MVSEHTFKWEFRPEGLILKANLSKLPFHKQAFYNIHHLSSSERKHHRISVFLRIGKERQLTNAL